MIKTHADVLEHVRKALVNLIREDDRRDQLAPISLDVFSGSKHRHQYVARVPAETPGPMIDIVHLDIARSGAVYKGCQVRSCFYMGPNDGRAIGCLKHRRYLTGHAAGIGEEAAHQRTEGVYNACLGGVHNVLRDLL